MTDLYREQLLIAVQDMQSEQLTRQLSAMTDDEMQDLIAVDLGLPKGTRFTDVQLEMLIEHELRGGAGPKPAVSPRGSVARPGEPLAVFFITTGLSVQSISYKFYRIVLKVEPSPRHS